MVNIWTLIQQNDWLISILITIIGLVITSRNLTKTFTYEINKVKQETSIKAMQDIPFELFNLMEKISDATKQGRGGLTNKNTQEYKKIISKIICYGSADLVKIATYFQGNNYNPSPESTQWTTLVLLSLMIVQMKSDLTGTVISPENYFKLKITDYSEGMKNIVKNDINRLVRKLDLNKGFSS